MSKWIWLDMDGTFVDLYGVENWLPDLESLSTRPYEVAKPLVNVEDLINALWQAKILGYNIGIISWLAKNPDLIYGERVTVAKLGWLEKYNLDLIIDRILIEPYGRSKNDVCKKYGYGILFDDEEPNRNAWKCGKAINPYNDLVRAIMENI